MRLTQRLAAVAFGLVLATAVPVRAQVSVDVGCSPGIPNCGSLRFFVQATGGVSVDQLFVTLLSPSVNFVSGPVPSTGTYSAQDSFGPFGGFTSIDGSATSLAVDFLENGFPFEVLASDVGTLDFEAAGVSDASGLFYAVNGVTSDGGTFAVSVTPEPASVALLLTGFAFLGVVVRRRKGTRS